MAGIVPPSAGGKAHLRKDYFLNTIQERKALSSCPTKGFDI
jgi:hypothetical protein